MFRIVLVIALVAVILVLTQTGAIAWVSEKIVGVLLQKPADDSRYATAMSDKLQDSPGCAKFKQDIFEAGRGSYQGLGRSRIVQSFTDATKAACQKP